MKTNHHNTDDNHAHDDPARSPSLPTPKWAYHASPQEDAFVRAYALTHNPRKAAESAGLPVLEDREAYRLLQTARCQERLVYYRELQSLKMDITDERLLSELSAVAFSDPAEMFDEQNNVLPIHKMPRHVRGTIRSIKINTTEDLMEDGTTRTKTQTEIHVWDKLKAIDITAKIKGLYDTQKAAPTVVIDMGKAQEVITVPLLPVDDDYLN